MNKAKLLFAKVLHCTICMYTLVYVLYATLQYGLNDLPWTALWPLIPLLMITFSVYFLTDRAWKYTVLQALVFAGFLFTGRAMEQVSAYMTTFVFCVILQIMEKRRNEELFIEPSWPFLVLFVVSFVYSLYSERTGVCAYLPYAMMLYMILTLLYLNEQGLSGFLDVRQNVKNQPLHQMASNNEKVMALVVAVLVIVFFLIAIVTGDSLVWWLMRKSKELFSQLMRKFFDWMGQSSQKGSESFHSPSFAPHGNSLPAELDRDSQPSLFENFFMFFGYVVVIGLVLMAIYGVVRFVSYWVRAYKNKKTRVVQAMDETVVDEVTWLQPRESRKKNRLSGKTAEERVRILYRQTILRERKKRQLLPPMPGLTPADIEAESFPAGVAPRGLHEMYEQARYSQIPVTEADEKTLRENVE